MTTFAQAVYPEKANSSLIEVDGNLSGSELLGQKFTKDSHMWGRIMQIDTATYKDKEENAVMYAFPANLSQTSKEYKALVVERIQSIEEVHPQNKGKAIPMDLVTSSGSGLDPGINS